MSWAQAASSGATASAARVEQIVADPGLEQVAKDEQGVGCAGGVG
jgi:hypothetical protein